MWKVLFLAATAFGLASTAAAESAGAVNETKIASYCSSSGDVCYGIFNRAGKVYLRITTAAHYFSRYRLCVRLLPPGASGAEHALRCGSFPVFRAGGGTWASRVNYARQYPIRNPGRYRVAWRLGSTPLGPPLYFRLPLH
jgi:hypothetical protein